MSKQNAKTTTSNQRGQATPGPKKPKISGSKATNAQSGQTTQTQGRGTPKVSENRSIKKQLARAESKSTSQSSQQNGTRISSPKTGRTISTAISASQPKSVRTGVNPGQRQIVRVQPLQYIGTVKVPHGYKDPASLKINEINSRRIANSFRKAYHDDQGQTAFKTVYPDDDDDSDNTTTTTTSISPKAIVVGNDPRIPTGRPSHALSMARSGGGYSSQIQARLRNKSPWYTSIQDPLHGADCKIPDATGEETGTIQIVQRQTIQANDTGVTGFQVITPYINMGNHDNTAGINMQRVNFASTDISITWGDGTTDGDGYGTEFSGAGDIRAVSNAHRVVSACMIVEHEASADSNQGEITLFVSPFSATNSPLYNTYVNLYSSVTIPLNLNKPGTVRWFPLSRQSALLNSTTNVIPFSYSDFCLTNSEEPPIWQFGFLCSGVDTGVAFKVTIVVNYEFLPSFNTLNVLSVSPSPVDEEEEALVTGWVETMPAAALISENKANSSPSTVSPQHGDEPTGFGMIANVIKEVIPFLPLLL